MIDMKRSVVSVCVSCLRGVPCDALPTLAALRTKERTIYASDDLAFPGMPVLGHKAWCAICERDVLPLAVDDEVAASLARYVALKDG